MRCGDDATTFSATELNRKETEETLTPMDRHFSTSGGANQRVLFICTGNFYRSRFAEAIFNHFAEERQIPWTAFSRGLAIHLAEGHLSPLTSEALKTRKIELRHTALSRMQLSNTDLERSNRRVALDRIEHFNMIVKQFPGWEDRIEYWEVPDLPFSSAEEALPEI